MIYDCFLYSGERDLLDIRLNELNSINVNHVLVQSNRTFTDNTKQLTVFWGYSNVTPIYVYDMPKEGSAWNREKHQRNAIMRGLDKAKDEDIIIISDADEIPSCEAVKSYRPEMGLTSLKMSNYWYKLNWLTEKRKWEAPRIMTYEYLKRTTPNEVRCSGFPSAIENGGWHFSYLGDADYIVNKLESFSHQEYNLTQFKDKDEITRKIENGLSLWGESQFECVPIDETFPSYIYKNQDRFKHLIKQI